MNEDILKGKWLEIRGEVKEKWAELIDNDLGKIEGKDNGVYPAKVKRESPLTFFPDGNSTIAAPRQGGRGSERNPKLAAPAA